VLKIGNYLSEKKHWGGNRCLSLCVNAPIRIGVCCYWLIFTIAYQKPSLFIAFFEIALGGLK
jgi:hypothetical protein